jgi:hypothetical protein
VRQVVVERTITASSASVCMLRTNDWSIQLIDRQALQVRERRVAGAEVVDRELQPIALSRSSVTSAPGSSIIAPR